MQQLKRKKKYISDSSESETDFKEKKIKLN